LKVFEKLKKENIKLIYEKEDILNFIKDKYKINIEKDFFDFNEIFEKLRIEKRACYSFGNNDKGQLCYDNKKLKKDLKRVLNNKEIVYIALGKLFINILIRI
jgi:hypothetical protein